MTDELRNKIQEIVEIAKNSEDRFAVWKGKLDDSDDIKWKIFVDSDYDNHEGDLLIRVKKR
jgi:hypothetical protein